MFLEPRYERGSRSEDGRGRAVEEGSERAEDDQLRV
jgi:hypothetical protein